MPATISEQGESKNIEGVFTVGGFSFAGQGQNAGIAFLPLKPWDDRHGKANTLQGDRRPGDRRAARNIATP